MQFFSLYLFLYVEERLTLVWVYLDFGISYEEFYVSEVLRSNIICLEVIL